MITAFQRWRTAGAAEASNTTTAAVIILGMVKVHASEAIPVATRHRETMGTGHRTLDNLSVGEITLDRTVDVVANVMTSAVGENTPLDPTATAPARIAMVVTTVKDAITKKIIAGKAGVKAATMIGEMASEITSEITNEITSGITGKTIGEMVAIRVGVNAAITVVGIAVMVATVKTGMTPSGPLTQPTRIVRMTPVLAQNRVVQVVQAGGKTKTRLYSGACWSR